MGTIDPKTKKILIVDDDELHNQVLELAFHKEGFQVVQAMNGKEALAMVESSLPDLITMDLGMPVMNGYEAIRQLNVTGFGSIPVIVITAHRNYTPSTEEGQSVQQPNVVDVIHKPVVLKELVDHVHRILKTR